MTEPIDDARGVRCHISCRFSKNMGAFKCTRDARRRKATNVRTVGVVRKCHYVGHDNLPEYTVYL